MKPPNWRGWVLSICGMTAAVVCTTGCASSLDAQPRGGDPFGRTYYIDGAGNWGYGVLEVVEGLRKAGYRGSVINYRWSPTFNPALDQTVGRPVARAKGKELGQEIARYIARYPDNQVNIIALSAGTGVAVWACEALRPPASVNSLVLLGSSLASDYNMKPALQNIRGGVWVYHSNSDQVLLGPVRALGTIDGKMGVDSAGLVGLHPVSGAGDKIHNVRWRPEFERYGWTGAHTDATCEPFVRLVIGPRHILNQPTPAGAAPAGHAYARLTLASSYN